MTTTERAAASDVSFPLCSFLPFQTASETRGLGFRANLWQPLSLGCAEPAPLEGEPFPLWRGINPSVTFGDSSLYTREPWGS